MSELLPNGHDRSSDDILAVRGDIQNLRLELQAFRNQDIPHFRAEATSFSATVVQLANSISALATAFDALKEAVKLQRDSISIKVFSYFVLLLIIGVGGIAAIQSYFNISGASRSRAPVTVESTLLPAVSGYRSFWRWRKYDTVVLGPLKLDVGQRASR